MHVPPSPLCPSQKKKIESDDEEEEKPKKSAKKAKKADSDEEEEEVSSRSRPPQLPCAATGNATRVQGFNYDACIIILTALLHGLYDTTGYIYC